jgi:hypothetical protein
MKRLQGLLSFRSVQAPNIDEMLHQRLIEDRSDVPVESADCKSLFAKRVASCMVQESGTLATQDGETVMSVNELNLRKMGLEIVVAWWMLPLLVSGVGVPLAKRVKTTLVEQNLAAANETDDESLWTACCFLIKMHKTPFLSGLVHDSHLPDLVAGLLQLGYSPASSERELGKKARMLLGFTLLNIDVDAVLETLLQFVSPSKPEWLAAAAGSLLSNTMCRPKAVIALLTLLLDDRTGSRAEEGIVSKAAVLVTTPPRTFASNPSDFYVILSEHLIGCLRHKSEDVRFCVALCVERLLRHDPDTVCTSFLHRLTAPLRGDSMSETEIDVLMSDLSLLLVPCGASGGTAADSFWGYWARNVVLTRRLFLLGCVVVGSASRLSAAMTNWLSGAMRLPSNNSHRRVLASAMILDTAIANTESICFQMGGTGGAVMRREVNERNWKRECRVFCSVVLDRAPAGVVGDIFAEVLQVVCTFSSSKPSMRYLLMLDMASELLLVPNLLQDVCQVLVVVKSVLGTDHVPESITFLVLSLLAELLPKLTVLKEHEMPLLVDLLPALEHAGHLHASLFDQCVATIEAIKQLSRASVKAQEGPVREGDIEEDFDRIVRDLADPLLPVRAHALIGLRELVLARDGATIAKFDRVLDLFAGQMGSEDSYLYLGAIQGLAALGDVAAARTIPFLLKDFHNPKLAVETRLKVGEALVTIAQRCGEMLPVYAPVLMDGFLRGIQDSNADVRVSSLANVGACCEILGWSIQAYIHEVILAVLSVLMSEKDLIVRRAGILVFALLIRGLGTERFLKLTRGQTSQMITRLNILADGDQDEVVKLQARQALEELSEY